MTTRPLHAVLAPAGPAGGARVLELLAAALDGTGPAILPLDPGLPGPRLAGLLAAFAPDTVEYPENVAPVAWRSPGGASPGVRDEIAVVLATSGSTGRPKGAELTAAALLASARASLARLAGTGRWLAGLPLNHISGLGILVRALVSDTEPVLTARIDPAALADAAAAGCEYVSLVPAQLRRLLDEGAPVGAFRRILLGGSAIPPELLAGAAVAGARVTTTYGMTETCGGCVYDGLALDGVSVRTDPDGRIGLSGPVLFSGYRLDPAATAEALRDGWFRTADLGAIGAGGRLEIRGRADDVINSGGEKVVAGEVEEALRNCRSVRDVVVVGVPDPLWGERVTALVVPADPAKPPTLEEIREHVSARLPRYAAPRQLRLVREIPMLSSGKPDRRRLRELTRAELISPGRATTS